MSKELHEANNMLIYGVDVQKKKAMKESEKNPSFPWRNE